MLARLRRVPLAVWAVTGLFGVTLVWWTHLTPMAQAPDEASHASLIEHLADGHGYPDYDTFLPYDGGMNAWVAHSTTVTTLTPEAAPARSARPSLEGWGGRSRWPYKNQIAQHPPPYYQASAAALRASRAITGPEDAPLDREWHLLRLGNVALVAPLPLLGWAAARRLGADASGAVAAAVAPLAIPQVTFIGGSVNNDNLLILLAGLLAIAVAQVLREDVRPSLALFVGALVGAALWTKAFALVYLPWIGLACGYLVVRRRVSLRQGAVALGIASGAALLTGAWWWVGNHVRHGDAFPSILDAEFRRPAPGFEFDPVEYLREYVPTLVHGFWGRFPSVEMTPVVVVVASALFAAAALAAVAPGRVGRPGPAAVPPGRAAAYATLIPLMAGLVLFLDWDRYRLSGLHAFMQGRYLFGALPVIMVVVGLGAARLLRARASLAILVLAAATQLDAVQAMLRALWAEPDASWTRSIEAMAAWSPWPPGALYALAALTAVVLVVTVRTLWRLSRPPHAGDLGGDALGRPGLHRATVPST
jgi:hypothetical protein